MGAHLFSGLLAVAECGLRSCREAVQPQMRPRLRVIRPAGKASNTTPRCMAAPVASNAFGCAPLV